MRITGIMVSLLYIGLVSCECDEMENGQPVSEMELVFGHFYGECIGESCIETFKLTETTLFEDTLDQYDPILPFAFVPLSSDLFLEVQDLGDSFPWPLWDETESVFGCPDCNDQGGLFIKLEVDGEVRSWRVDQDQAAVPDYLHAFMDEVNLSIALLQ